MGGLESDGIDEELLFYRDKGVVEHACLRPDVGECRGGCTNEIATCSATGCCKKAIADSLIGLFWTSVVESVWRVCGCVEMDEVLACSVSVVIMNWDVGAIDWELLKVGSTMTVQLRVQVRKDSTLKQRILTEVNSTDDMTGLELMRVSMGFRFCFLDELTITCSVSAK